MTATALDAASRPAAQIPAPASGAAAPVSGDTEFIEWFECLDRTAGPRVGGKCAHLGELVRARARVPPGFAVGTAAFQRFLAATGLDARIREALAGLGPQAGPERFEEASRTLRAAVEAAPMPAEVSHAIRSAYRDLAERVGTDAVPVAIRSSATTEDLADASFAGQQDTFLNVRGEGEVLRHVQRCWSSLFTPRALFYRREKGIPDGDALIAVGVQRMVRADAAGVLFTLDPVTGDTSRIVIEASWGLGEFVVGGRVRPDRFVLDKATLRVIEQQTASKAVELVYASDGARTAERPVPPERRDVPSLTPEQLRALGDAARRLEGHFGSAQDIEFAVEAGQLYFLQARPETVWTRRSPATTSNPGAPPRPVEASRSEGPVVRGLAASPGIHCGKARVVRTPQEASQRLEPGDVLVTKMTNPDWVPYMKLAGAIVTDDGGTTCHAAIVSREMGLPCIVGARDATGRLRTGDVYTVDAKQGLVYAGRIDRLLDAPRPSAAATGPVPAPPVTSTRVYVNLSIPELAEKVCRETQADGVGLLRAEHLLLSVGKHPRLLIEEGGAQTMVDAFAEGIRKVAAPFAPRPAVYRFLDFKPDEFLDLPGGQKYEKEAGHVGPNPLIGYRGCYRYLKEPDVFRLECRALRKVREEFKLRNVHAMLPFVRTVEEVRHAKRILEEEGLVRGPDFKLWIMVEVPSTVLCIDRFVAEGIDGVSFGTNDLTMLLLGIDRDDASIQEIYDERNPAVLRAMAHVLRVCAEAGITTSICGQAPSNHPEVVEFLVGQGATSLSVNPDKVLETKHLVASVERKLILEATRNARQNGHRRTAPEPGWTF